jgi:hypothetical protein
MGEVKVMEYCLSNQVFQTLFGPEYGSENFLLLANCNFNVEFFESINKMNRFWTMVKFDGMVLLPQFGVNNIQDFDEVNFCIEWYFYKKLFAGINSLLNIFVKLFGLRSI